MDERTASSVDRASDDRRFWVFAFGALAGGLVGLLLAPLAGRETRGRLARSLRKRAAAARAARDRRRGQPAEPAPHEPSLAMERASEATLGEPMPADRLP